MQNSDDKPMDSPEFSVPDYLDHTDGIDYAVSTYRDDDDNWVYVTKEGKEITENEVYSSGNGLKSEYDLKYAPKDPRPIKYRVTTSYRYNGIDQLNIVDAYTDVELRQALSDARDMLGVISYRAHTITTIKRIMSVANSGVRKWLYYRHHSSASALTSYNITVQTNYEVK